MKRKMLICLAVFIAVVLPITIYCNQIPLAQWLGPEGMFGAEVIPPPVYLENAMIIRVGMVISLTLVCETVASFIFSYALTL